LSYKGKALRAGVERQGLNFSSAGNRIAPGT